MLCFSLYTVVLVTMCTKMADVWVLQSWIIRWNNSIKGHDKDDLHSSEVENHSIDVNNKIVKTLLYSLLLRICETHRCKARCKRTRKQVGDSKSVNQSNESFILCVKHAGMISVSKDLRDSKSMDQSNKSLSVMCETCMSKRSRHQYIQW